MQLIILTLIYLAYCIYSKDLKDIINVNLNKNILPYIDELIKNYIECDIYNLTCRVKLENTEYLENFTTSINQSNFLLILSQLESKVLFSIDNKYSDLIIKLVKFYENNSSNINNQRYIKNNELINSIDQKDEENTDNISKYNFMSWFFNVSDKTTRYSSSFEADCIYTYSINIVYYKYIETLNIISNKEQKDFVFNDSNIKYIEYLESLNYIKTFKQKSLILIKKLKDLISPITDLPYGGDWMIFKQNNTTINYELTKLIYCSNDFILYVFNYFNKETRDDRWEIVISKIISIITTIQEDWEKENALIADCLYRNSDSNTYTPLNNNILYKNSSNYFVKSASFFTRLFKYYKDINNENDKDELINENKSYLNYRLIRIAYNFLKYFNNKLSNILDIDIGYALNGEGLIAEESSYITNEITGDLEFNNFVVNKNMKIHFISPIMLLSIIDYESYINDIGHNELYLEFQNRNEQNYKAIELYILNLNKNKTLNYNEEILRLNILLELYNYPK